ncbi:MAG: DMT family transporter [Ectothiorhodospiraceae bacterium]|nr:DMT family transporter [Ectothiorhodospiraceae bacterium]
MSGRTVHGAIVLLIIGNLLAMFSDIVVKIQGADVPVFQFVFLRLLVSVLLLLPMLPFIGHRVLLAGRGIHLVRAHVGMAAIVCMVVALTRLPLATANAVFYVAPILIMVLAVLVYRERLTPLSVLTVVSGFSGVIVALRPVEFSWAAFAALGSALALAVNALLVRKLPAEHTPAHNLLLAQAYALPAALALAIWEGAPWDWTLLRGAAGSSVFILAYHLSVLIAYRHVAANRITGAEYTGLVWAVIFGWWWFGEIPDLWFAVGAILITGPLLIHGVAESRRRVVSPAT